MAEVSNQDKIFTIIRYALSIIGGYLLLKGLATEGVIQEGIGIVMEIAAIVWSIVAKTVKADMINGALRHVFAFVGGILVARGRLSVEELNTYMGIALAVGSYIVSLLTPKNISTSQIKTAKGEVYVMKTAKNDLRTK